MNMLEDSFSQFSLLSADASDDLWRLLTDQPDGQDVTEEGSAKLGELVVVLKKMAKAAADSGLPGLESLIALLEANLEQIISQCRGVNAAEKSLLEAWPELLMGYMLGQGSPEATRPLIDNLASPAWPVPLANDEAEILLQMLQPEISSESEAVVADSAINRMRMEGGEPAPMVIDADTPPVVIPEEVKLFTIPPAELQQVDSDLVNMLAEEFSQMSELINEDLSAAVSGHFSVAERQQALANFSEAIERLALASESSGLIALGRVISRLVAMIKGLQQELDAAQHGLLEQLTGRVTSYLAWPSDRSAGAALIDLLADHAWPRPLPEKDVDVWVASLSNVEMIQREQGVSDRQTEAAVDDISLAVPEDINAELLDGLLQELPQQTSAFTAAIEKLSAGIGAATDVNRAMRAAHTLKGAANTVGVKGIANLTHHLEDILVALSEEGLVPNQELSAVLVTAGDCLEAMSEALMGVGPVPDQALEIFQSVLDCANRIDREGVHELGSAAVMVSEQEVMPEGGLQESVHDAPAQKGQGLRVSAPVVDELLRLAGETLISNSQIQDRLRQTVKQADAMRQQQQLLNQLISELENLVDIRGVAAPRINKSDQGEFDPLEFENFSELHTVTRRLIEASSDSQQILSQVNEQFGVLNDLLEIQHRLQISNQHAVIRTRMVPVSSVVSRLQRSVRQTCRLLDKQVELQISGDATNIDSNVLTDLMDPLMHILRNAVDHGIDDPEARLAAGKPPVGRIDLAFSREGNSIVVRCKDDGSGLDFDAIRRIAESKGMITPERNMSTDELTRLILVNGFSTRDETTQVSGRGVGMDIVYNRVLQMKGTLALNSERGKGLTVELRLPATLLSAHALIVRHGEKLLAISTRGVEDIHYVMPEQIEKIGTQLVYRVGNEVHSLLKLEQLLALPPDRRESDRLGFPVLLTRMDDGSMNAILVQEVIDGREVVLKNFGKYVPKIQGAIGAVILGDGSVAPVVDLVEMLRVPIQHDQTERLENHAEARNEVPDSQTALVVDDSLTARRAAAKLMKDAGYNVRTAIDGLEAVSILHNYVPDIMLVDMEMPRMNGLELTAHVRNAARTKDVPVIMITSRSTEKHRQQGIAAGVNVYLTKPFSDEKLLDHVARLTGTE